MACHVTILSPLAVQAFVQRTSLVQHQQHCHYPTTRTIPPGWDIPSSCHATRRSMIAHTPGHHDDLDVDPWFGAGDLEIDWSTIMESPNNQESTTDASAPLASPNEPLTTQDVRTLSIASITVVAGLAGMIAASGPGAWRYYLAGGVCAAVSHTIPVPIDVVKTRKQVDPAYCDLAMWTALRKLVQTEGASALFV